MKKVLTILLVSLMLASALAGCAAKGESSEPAMQLDMVQLVETAKAEAARNTDAPEYDPGQAVAAPAHVTDELVSEKGWLKVHVDADVLLPDAPMPMVRLAPKEITLDDAQHYAEALFDPEARYVDWRGSERKTKSYWKMLADELQYDMDHWEEFGKRKWDMKYETLEAAKEELTKRFAAMEAAPESLPEITPLYEWQYSTVEHASGGTSQAAHFELFATKDDAHVSALHIGDTQISFTRDSEHSARGVLGARQTDVSEHAGISQESAFAVAEQTMERIGIDGMTCTYQAGYISDYPPHWYGYDFIYEREVSGVPVTFVNHGNDRNGREHIRINVDKAGVTTLYYHFPMLVQEIITPNAALLPFDQIKAVFDRMVMVVSNQTESAAWNRAGMPDLTADYYIKEIRLGLAPMKESGDAGRYLLVPAWDFIGYSTGAVDGRDQGIHDTNEKSSFLTINAVDGTVIERIG